MAAGEQRGFADQLSIATPEQVELEFSTAGLGSRFVAVLLDHLIQFGVLIVLGLGSGLLVTASSAVSSLGKWFIAIFIGINFLIIWGYFTFFEAYWHGQTPGKRVMKLRVIKDSGRQITLFEAMSRNLLRIVDYLPALYLTGVITMLCTRRSQRLGDLAAGTIVVHERADEQPLLIGRGTSLFPRVNSPSYEPLAVPPPISDALPADAVARLGADDLVLIETFFARVLDLPLTARADLATRIAAQIAVKMYADPNVTPPSGNPERFLESVAHAMRGRGRTLR